MRQHVLATGILFVVLIFLTQASANVVGTDAQNFNTTTSGLDFVTVHSSETLEPGILNMGLFTSYAKNTFSYLGVKSRSGGDFEDGMISADFNLGMGLGKNWDAGVSFPWLVSAWDNGTDQDRVQLKDSGLTEVRVNTKYRLSGDKSGGTAVIATANFGNIKNNPYAGAGAGPTFNLEFAADKTLGKRVTIGGNLGYRHRTPGRKIEDFPIEPLGDQVIGSVAANYLIPDSDTKLIAEIYGSWPTNKVTQNTDRTQTTFEVIGGLKHDITPSLALHGGGGTKLANGNASPDYRVYVGVNYVMGPLFGKPKVLLRRISPKFKDGDFIDEGMGTSIVGLATESSERFIAGEILFGFGSDRVVQDGSKEALAQFAEHVEKPPRYTLVIIEGHTDSIGSAGYNLDLSQRRADNIRRYLVETHGLDPKRVKAMGFGESKPIADNGNFQGRALNRRVEFRIFREGSNIPEEYRR